MTLREVLHTLVDRLPGWDSVPDMHAAIDEHFGYTPPEAEAEGEPEPAPKAPRKEPAPK